MFEFVRTHNKWLMLGLLLLILPSFVFVGVSGYSGFIDGSANAAATVGGQRITQAEWDMAHRQASERVRQQQPDVDAKLLDSPQAKQEALDGLIQQRLLAVAAQSQHLEVSNERLKSRFERDPQLEIARTPTGAVNKAVLAAQGMTEEGFIQRYREDLRARQVLSPLQQASGHLPTVSGGLAFDALLQRRAVRVQHFNPSAFLAQVQVSDDELTAHYQKPEIQKQWQRPESAQIEYLVLEVQALKAAVTVSEADLRAFYEQNASRYNQAEERRARHILLKVEDPSKDGDQKAKAESLLTELRKAPEKFAELARQHSQDEGSAANGGDLDFFARGAMVKPFEDAVYALKAGEISPPVRSEFGWHIIKLEATRGGEVRPFEAVRAEIEESQRTQLARQRYQELAESFSTTVFEQPDSLEPAAKKLGLTIQRATVQRQPAPGQDAGPLTSAKLIEAVFSAETLRNKRNTDAVETAANQMVSARVLNHQPAAAPPLAEVKEAVRQQLRAHRAAELAKKAGAERLGKGVAGGNDGFAETQWISRAKPEGLPQPVLEAVLRAPSDKLPALVGVDQGSAGYWLVRLEQLGDREADLIPPDVAAKQVAQAWAAAEARAYLDALKRSHKVKQNAARPVTASSGS